MKCDCDYILPSNKDWEPHYQNCTTNWSKNHNTKSLKNDDGTLRLQNVHLTKLDNDILYHLGLDTQNNDLPKMFGDVKFVCMGGTKYRMREFADHIAKNVLKKSVDLVNLTKHSHRYAMFKVGPVLSVNHGVGIPSMTVLLQEIIKLLSYAKAKDPIIFRIGTSGGLDIPPGSVVISSWAMNGSLKKSYEIPIMGKMLELDSTFDMRLNQELYHLAKEEKGFLTMIGGTMAADDFYRGQARLDGPFCHYNENDKLNFLHKLESLGVKNIDMEVTAFAAMTREAGLRSAVLCVTIVDRLVNDQVTPSKEQLLEWQKRPMFLIEKYISAYLKGKAP